jgi:cobaltochelatase CobS
MAMKYTAALPNAAFGFPESKKATPGFKPEDFPAQLHAWIPRRDPRHVFPLKTFIMFRAWWMIGENEPMTLSGPQGCGKTSFVNQWASRVNVPVYSYTCNRRSEKSDLIGTMLPSKDGAMWVDGPATRAWRHGGIVLVNEPSLADDLGPAINDLTEGAPIEIPQTNEIIERHPNARIIFTDNIRGLVGDESGMLQGRNLQDASAKDRDHQLDLDYMTADEEIPLFVSYMPEFGTDPTASAAQKKQMATTLRNFAADVRAAYIGQNATGDAQLECTMSTRTALRFLKLMIAYKDATSHGIVPLHDALAQALTSKVSDASRQAVRKLAELHFGA